jgi:fluoride exporter
MKALLLVGLGGGIGSMLRYVVSLLTFKNDNATFPWSTFIVNVIGCLIIGLLFSYFEKQELLQSNLKLLFITGFCGGFTTFSTFALENVQLIQSGNLTNAIIYSLSSVIVGISATIAGLYLIK